MFRSPQQKCIVILGKLAIASATRNPEYCKGRMACVLSVTEEANTGCKSFGEVAMTRRILLIAVCCFGKLALAD